MSIIVNPHNSKEEKALLAFLDNMKYDYIMDNETHTLSEAQQLGYLSETGNIKPGRSKPSH